MGLISRVAEATISPALTAKCFEGASLGNSISTVRGLISGFYGKNFTKLALDLRTPPPYHSHPTRCLGELSVIGVKREASASRRSARSPLNSGAAPATVGETTASCRVLTEPAATVPRHEPVQLHKNVAAHANARAWEGEAVEENAE